MVPDEARIEQIPIKAYAQECWILAAVQMDNYSTTQHMIAANWAWWTKGSTRGRKRSQATGMTVERFLVDLVALLDINDLPEEPESNPLHAV